MEDSHVDLKDRTKAFAVRIIKLFSSLPKTTEAQVLGKQILRSGTSVGAQYHESQYAKSDADLDRRLVTGTGRDDVLVRIIGQNELVFSSKASADTSGNQRTDGDFCHNC